jgi:hypothetical protein
MFFQYQPNPLCRQAHLQGGDWASLNLECKHIHKQKSAFVEIITNGKINSELSCSTTLRYVI